MVPKDGGGEGSNSVCARVLHSPQWPDGGAVISCPNSPSLFYLLQLKYNGAKATDWGSNDIKDRDIESVTNQYNEADWEDPKAPTTKTCIVPIKQACPKPVDGGLQTLRAVPK
jgi:hypothetical protein